MAFGRVCPRRAGGRQEDECSFLGDGPPGRLCLSGMVGGCLAELLRQAKVGAIILCTDAGNSLWPALLATAKNLGWHVQNGPKRPLKAGPKSCCFMEKLEQPPVDCTGPGP